jgi:hypothetical protein
MDLGPLVVAFYLHDQAEVVLLVRQNIWLLIYLSIRRFRKTFVQLLVRPFTWRYNIYLRAPWTERKITKVKDILYDHKSSLLFVDRVLTYFLAAFGAVSVATITSLFSNWNNNGLFEFGGLILITLGLFLILTLLCIWSVQGSKSQLSKLGRRIAENGWTTESMKHWKLYRIGYRFVVITCILSFIDIAYLTSSVILFFVANNHSDTSYIKVSSFVPEDQKIVFSVYNSGDRTAISNNVKLSVFPEHAAPFSTMLDMDQYRFITANKGIDVTLGSDNIMNKEFLHSIGLYFDHGSQNKTQCSLAFSWNNFSKTDPLPGLLTEHPTNILTKILLLPAMIGLDMAQNNSAQFSPINCSVIRSWAVDEQAEQLASHQ